MQRDGAVAMHLKTHRDRRGTGDVTRPGGTFPPWRAFPGEGAMSPPDFG